MSTALITGITGQDGSYLAELLLGKGYEVHGVARDPEAAVSSDSLAAVAERIVLHRGDLRDADSLEAALAAAEPDEVYNLAAATFVGGAWSDPLAVAETTGLGAVRLFEAVRACCPDARVLQASSSDMFGRAAAVSSPQGLDTPFDPVNPYGAAKLYAHTMAGACRDAFELHVNAAILFNHESPRRGPDFVTRKITRAVAEIAAGRREELRLGSLDARRDWGFAGDYVEALWRMLQRDEPGDLVIGTGVAHSVRELVELAFAAAALDPERFLVVDPALLRPVEIPELRADISATRAALGWEPTVGFEELVATMVAADREQVG